MEEEHEVYGGDIPEEVEGDVDGDLDGPADDLNPKGEEIPADDVSSKELEEMKKRLKEMEEEAAALRDMQAKVEKEMSAVQDPAGTTGAQANREEADARSVFVGNVDYSCTPEEVQQHFQSCGTVNRVTILTDKFGQPKGYAYVEFLEVEAVQNAILLSESELHNRPIKMLEEETERTRFLDTAMSYGVIILCIRDHFIHSEGGLKDAVAGHGKEDKRTRNEGFSGGRFAPYYGYRPRRPYPPPYGYAPYGYGKVPRFRRPMRYRPYY